MGSKPVTVMLGAGGLTVDISVAASEAAPGSRDVFCAVTAAHEALSAAIEGATAWLEETVTGAVSQEQALDEFGDAAFTGVAPGQYNLHLQLGGQRYAVLDIELPS